MTLTYTTFVRAPKPAFNQGPWHTDMHTALDRLDAAIYNAIVAAQIASSWANSTAYSIGEVVIDTSDGSFWVAMVAHTSAASPTTFAATRAANPTYWNGINLAINPAGAWANDTAYSVLDLVHDSETGIVALCTTGHTSSSSPATINTDAANWQFLINLTSANVFGIVNGYASLPWGSVVTDDDQVLIMDASASLTKRMSHQEFWTSGRGIAAQGGAVAVDDDILTWDTSNGYKAKHAAVSDFLKVIGLLTSETAPALDDGLALYDTSTGTTDFISLTNLLKILALLTAKSTPVVGDKVTVLDSAASDAPKLSTLAQIFAIFSASSAEMRAQVATNKYVTPAGLKQRPLLLADKNGSTQGTVSGSGTHTKITWNPTVDQGGYSANSTWTPPAGRYRISATLFFNNTNAIDNEILGAMIYKNGSVAFEEYRGRAGATGQGVTVSAVVDADGDDTFEIYAYKSGAGACSIMGTTTQTYLSAEAV